jgi:hypothetical protein
VGGFSGVGVRVRVMRAWALSHRAQRCEGHALGGGGGGAEEGASQAIVLTTKENPLVHYDAENCAQGSACDEAPATLYRGARMVDQQSCVRVWHALHGVAWRCMALHGVAWRCMALHGMTRGTGNSLPWSELLPPVISRSTGS